MAKRADKVRVSFSDGVRVRVVKLAILHGKLLGTGSTSLN